MSVSQSRRFVAPLIVSTALLMETMDATVLATALPTIATTLHAPALSLKLALTTYLVALAAFIPISGWMADRIGAKPLFMAAMAVFPVGSILCALQTDLACLILARGSGRRARHDDARWPPDRAAHNREGWRIVVSYKRRRRRFLTAARVPAWFRL